MSKQKREKIPQTEVLAWLQANHPELHATAEVDRSWVWITANLKDDAHKATRESIKQFGFIFARREGGHPLSSGNKGTWGHSCDKPLAFRRKPSKAKVGQGDDTQEGERDTLAEADAFFAS